MVVQFEDWIDIEILHTNFCRLYPMRCKRHLYHTFLSFLLLAFIAPILKGQDAQFSQFYANPLYLNPALAGSHSGTYRVMMSYRNQWSGPLENPFVSYSAGGDIKFNLRNSQGSYTTGNDVVAVGVQFFSDRVNQFDYDINHLAFYGAYHKMLNPKTNQYLSGGIQFALGQRGINYEDVTFQDQFNGVDQFNFPTQESLPANSIAYPDLAIGLHYSVQPKPDQGFYFGLSYFHWNRPNVSLFNRDQRFEEQYGPFELAPKLSVHGGMSLNRSDLLAIQPRVIYIQQGQAATVIAGSNLKYRMVDSDGVAFHLGGWIRASDNITTFQPTDLIISGAYERNGLQIGISYDYSLRSFTNNRFGNGTFELSISYIGEHESANNICPDF